MFHLCNTCKHNQDGFCDALNGHTDNQLVKICAHYAVDYHLACPYCRGHGYLEDTESYGDINVVTWSGTCRYCKGTGKRQ